MKHCKKPRIGFAGMTHLGLVSATALCSKGFLVFCYDKNKELIEKIKKGTLPVSEPLLKELLNKNKNQVFDSHIKILSQCDIVYIAADVPTNSRGKSELSKIKALIKNVSKVVSKNTILVILSQVPPGFTRKIHFPKDRLCYQVETLIFGRAVERALYPERFIIGCVEDHIPIPSLLKLVLKSYQCPILKMTYESAELCKISINLFLVASVSVTNTVSEVCEKIGAQWLSIVSALRLDKRIGKYAYLNPGLGISGGNLERDLASFIRLSKKYKTHAEVVQSFINDSQYRKKWVYRILKKVVLGKNKNPVVAILGLTYKENTHSLKNSPSIALLEDLKSRQIQVQVHDPVACIKPASYITVSKTSLKAIQGADVLVMMTPWPEYKNISITQIAQLMKGNTILDPYQILGKKEKIGFDYYCLGHGDSYA